jgi:hypothetical protein
MSSLTRRNVTIKLLQLTQRLNSGRHSIRRVHASTCTRPWTRMLQDLLALFLCDLIVYVLSIGLESADYIQGRASRRLLARTDSPSVDHDGRPVQATHGHDTTRHVLVAARQGNQAVVPLTPHGSLDRVGNQVARLQRVSHARRPHGDAVGHADGVEAVAHAVGRHDAPFDLFGQVEQVHVAGVALVPDGADADLRLVHVLFLEAGGVQHGLRGALHFCLRQRAAGERTGENVRNKRARAVRDGKDTAEAEDALRGHIEEQQQQLQGAARSTNYKEQQQQQQGAVTATTRSSNSRHNEL